MRYLTSKLKHQLSLAFCLLAFAWGANAQFGTNEQKYRYMSVSGLWSKVEVHSRYVKNLNNTFPLGIALSYGTHDYSAKAIDTYGCHIRVGGTIQYWNFNHDVLGSGLATLVYAEPFLFTRDRFMSSIRASAGLIGLTKPYHEQSNPNNLAYCTHVAFPLSVELNFYFPLSYKWALTLSGGFNHFSNGGIEQPNYGLNHTSLLLGVEYNFRSYGVPPRSYAQNLKLSHAHKRWQREVAASLAIEDGTADEEKTLYLLLNAKYYYQLTRINGLGAGLLVENKLANGEGDEASSAVSLAAGHRFYLGRFTFTQDMAFSLFGSLNDDRTWYQFYAIDYALTPNLLLGANLKAHGKTADFVGARVGLRW